MRIYDTSDAARFLTDLRQIRTRLDSEERNLSTGRRLHRPGDDPAQVSVALKLRQLQSEATAYRGRQEHVHGLLDGTEQALNQLDELVTHARETAIEAQSPTGTGQGAGALADVIDGLREQAIGIGNTKLADTFLFGGTRFGGRNPPTPEPRDRKSVV